MKILWTLLATGKHLSRQWNSIDFKSWTVTVCRCCGCRPCHSTMISCMWSLYSFVTGSRVGRWVWISSFRSSSRRCWLWRSRSVRASYGRWGRWPWRRTSGDSLRQQEVGVCPPGAQGCRRRWIGSTDPADSTLHTDRDAHNLMIHSLPYIAQCLLSVHVFKRYATCLPANKTILLYYKMCSVTAGGDIRREVKI